jgi:hypothetical protein
MATVTVPSASLHGGASIELPRQVASCCARHLPLHLHLRIRRGEACMDFFACTWSPVIMVFVLSSLAARHHHLGTILTSARNLMIYTVKDELLACFLLASGHRIAHVRCGLRVSDGSKMEHLLSLDDSCDDAALWPWPPLHQHVGLFIEWHVIMLQWWNDLSCSLVLLVEGLFNGGRALRPWPLASLPLAAPRRGKRIHPDVRGAAYLYRQGLRCVGPRSFVWHGQSLLAKYAHVIDLCLMIQLINTYPSQTLFLSGRFICMYMTTWACTREGGSSKLAPRSWTKAILWSPWSLA